MDEKKVSTSFVINDGVSSSINNMTSAIKDLMSSVDKLGKELGNLDSTSLDKLEGNVGDVGSRLDKVTKSAKGTTSQVTSLDKTDLNHVDSKVDNLGRSINEVTTNAKQADSAIDEMDRSSNNLSNGLGRLVGAFGGLQGAKAILNWSDEITQTKSRLDLVVNSFNEINGAQQTTRELQNEIYQAAQRSRGSYSDLENLVASLGNNAKDAFSSTQEMVDFAEALNKAFVIGGASSQEMSAATLQLTQGLSSGVLQGDELRSILEQAPILTNILADSLGVSVGELRDMGSEGKITADVVKNAVLGSAKDIDSQFQSMDTTFSQMWTKFANMAQHAIEPISKYAAGASAALMGVFSAMQMIAQVNESGGLRPYLTGNQALPKNKTSKGKMPGSNLTGNASKAITGSSKALAELIPSPVIKAVETLTSKFKNLASTILATAKVDGAILTDVLSISSRKMKDFGNSIIGAITNTKFFTSVLAPLGHAFGGTVTSMAPLIGSLGSIAGMAALAVSGIGLLGAALGKLNENGQASEKVDKFFQNFTQSVSTFGDRAVGAINEFVETLPQKLPRLIEQGSKLVGSIITGLTNAIPQLLSTGGQIVGALLTGVIKSLPTVVTGGIQFIGNLAQSITDNAPTFFNKAGELITGFVSYLTTNIPVFFQCGVDMLANLLNGFASNFPGMVQKGLDLIGQLLTNFRDHFPEFLQQGVQLIGSIVQGIGQALPTIGGAIWNVITTIVGTLWDNRGEIIHAGWDLLTALGQGLLNIAGFLWDSLLEVGGQVVDGIKVGISNAWSGFTGWIKDTFWGIVDSIKSVLGISSPSTIMKDEVGFNIVEGLKQGISGAWDGLMTVASGLWNSFLGLFGGNDKDSQIIDYSAQIAQTQEQLATLQAQVQTGYTNILTIVQTKNAEIVQAGIGMFGQMTGVVITDAQNMVNGITGIFSQIPIVVGNSFSAALPVAQENLIAITAMANDQITQLVTRSQNALYEIIPAFTTVLDALKNNMLTIMNSMNNGIIAITTSFGNIYVSIFQSTFDRVITLYGAFQTRAIAATNDLINAIDRVLDSRLPNVFSDAINTAMNDFIEGITSRISEATSATSKLVEAVKAAFVKGLGIHSPSHITYYYGTMTGEGFINGLTDTQLVEFAESILTQIVDAFNGNRFNANELVSYLGDDTQQVINYYREHPDLLEGKDSGSQTIAYPLAGGPWPITSPFGPRWGRLHAGTDIGAKYETPILSALPGNVSVSQTGYYGYGTAVKVDTPPYEFIYGHMASTAVNVGQQVSKGQVIGYVDSTGNSTGDHLHFETRLNGEPFNNASLLAGATINAQSGVVAAIESAYQQYKAMQYLKQYGLMGDSIPAELYDGTSVGLLPLNWTAPPEVARWAPQVLTALAMLGQPAGLLNGVLWGINGESGGDPNAVYLGDVNRKYGGSKGLLQTIPDNFKAYGNPNLSSDICDPLANIYACLNEMIHVYGSIQNVINKRIQQGHWSGYAVGTRYVPQDMLAMIHKGEAIIPASQNPYRDSGGNYLAEIAQRTVENSPTMEQMVGEVIPMYSGGNQDVTINLSFGDINNHGDLDNAKEEIIRTIELGLQASIDGKGSVGHAY